VIQNNPSALIVITGHSLGGGVAVVNGALNQIPAIGISAPNAKLSHRFFGISEKNIDLYTYNVIPERDIFPRVDDPPLSIENIRCRVPENDSVFECHASTRTLCELMFSCGSGERPPLNCTEFGYPTPTRL